MVADRTGQIGVVVIGRNEGDRLRRCLASLAEVAPRVYVDSASSDDSVAMAQAGGTAVVTLSVPPRLTAARGRNAGLAYLTAQHADLMYIQFVDGDCEVQPGWIAAAAATLDADPGLAAVFGRRRERFPERSIYNALCDDEWNVAVGEVLTCGGDVMCRVDAVTSIGGYDEDMIAGEDPDMSTRLRKQGWRLRRIDAEMTLHDAAILTFGQWRKRATRAGHAFAELADRHPDVAAPAWRRRCRSIVLWALIIPALTLGALLAATRFGGWLWLVPLAALALWPAQMARIALRQRRRLPARVALASGVLMMVGKFPELLGLLRYGRGKRNGDRATLIEYKGAAQ